MFVKSLHALTSSRLAVVSRDATVQEAAVSLSRPGVGLVAVCSGTGSLEGVLSKSDLIRHLCCPNAASAPASALMSRSVVTCSPEEGVHEVWQAMTARGLQNVPVVDDASRPVGMLDIRDAMKALFEEEALQERMLFNYVTGVGYR